MVLLKSCPRCHGDLQLNKDLYGEYKECLQCGYMEDLERGISRSRSFSGEAGKRKAA